LNLKNTSLVVLASMAALGLSACNKENSQDVAVEAGIQCLNTAQTAAQADNCQAAVAGINTAEAYVVRCSANLVAQGLTGTRISTAFQQLNNATGSGATNATASLLSYVVFAQNLPLDTAALTYTNCTATNDPGLVGLANLIQIATTVASLDSNYSNLANSPYNPGSPSYDPAALATEIATLNSQNNPTTNAAIGSLAVSAQAAYCTTGSPLATQIVCTELNSAVQSGSGNAANTGKSLLNLLAH
jgi:hypothetical protein